MSSNNNNPIQFYDLHPKAEDFYTEILDGLRNEQKTISPKYLYDKKGSEIFEEITELPEYYVTRTEKTILEDNAIDIASYIQEGCLLVEPGSGSSEKVRILLDAIKPSVYVPMEISKSHLKSSAQSLSEDYPWLDVHAACVDFTTTDELPYAPKNMHKVAFFPGSTIGNFEPEEAIRLLNNISKMVGSGGGLLIGVDLKKDKSTLEAAYSDKEGVTASFNYNLLTRINRELDANFKLDEFDHHAFYNKEQGRMESHLISQCEQTVSIDSHSIDFEQGESIHTENSYKYSINEFNEIARQAGFEDKKVWTDDDELFSVHYLECK
ncbi:MAG: L-histidine N(alpha)-methyltransferase [Gammaproteobacteria bacterium]|nr:L-histidine N(alpha)-methyltransferase [Gammaproteobacteria bacterium]